MAKIVMMPKLGMTMTEGTICEWKKKEGEHVSVGDDLFEVETDKLTNTVKAMDEGTLAKIIVKEGDTVPCQATVAVLSESGEDITQLTADRSENDGNLSSPEPVPDVTISPDSRKSCERIIISPRAKKVASELGIDPALVSGSGPNGRIVEKDVRAAAEGQEKEKVRISPLAKVLSEDLGISPSDVPSSGRIMAEDILNYLKQKDGSGKELPEEIVPMNGMRRAIARNMLNSHMTSPTVTFSLSVDMTNAKAFRAQLSDQGIRVSYTDILVKFVAKALTEYPDLNCSISDNKIIYKKYVNMGVAVALDNGLVVPNVTDADKKNLAEISSEVRTLAEQAREGSLPAEKLHGGTFTITNLGMYGIEDFTPIINQPEVAILGVCTMKDQPVVVNGEVTVRTMMNLCLTADHRVVDGAIAARFMQRVKNLLENPALMLV